MSEPPLSFPPLIDLPAEPWRWPALPSGWRHEPAPDLSLAQPCVVDSLAGKAVDGEALGFDAAAGVLRFRGAPGGRIVSLHFTRFSRLTLTVPLRPLPARNGMPAEPFRAASELRDYTLVRVDGSEPLRLRSAGHVEAAEGLYLFPPLDDEAALCRAFVPRSGYSFFEFGATVSERAARAWIVDRNELLTAVELQQRKPVRPLGLSLLELGLVTPGQLERALALPQTERPLGETLVEMKLITRAELRLAIAHKMGYPMVDLTRFPIDPDAVERLPRHLATGFRAVPLVVDQGRLIVAVDKPSRAAKLQALTGLAQVRVVAVLAPRVQVLAALQRLATDVAAGHLQDQTAFFQTTL